MNKNTKLSKRIITILLSALIIIMTINGSIIVNAATNKTQSEAVNWAVSQCGKSLDYDGSYGAQCVDLILYYYKYLGKSTVKGNAKDYATNSLPSGWVRLKSNYTVQPGDIAVFKPNVKGFTYEYGHIGIVYSGSNSGFTLIDQNSYEYGQKVAKHKESNYKTANMLCIIRPDFKDYVSTFKFNSNGGSGSMSNKSVAYNTSVTLPANSFTKPGYSFSHWNSYRASDGKWYTNENGWQTALAISSNGYTKKSYGNKWSGNFNNSWLNGKAKDTFTFYAVWSPNKLTITYNANGGSINSDKYYLNSGSNVYKYETYAALTDTRKYNETNKNGLYDAATFGIYRTGYTFKGWRSYDNGVRVFRDDDSTVTPYDINSSILNGNCNTTLYAVWEKNECSHLYLFDITKQPTCEENGIKTFTCIYCGDSYTTSVSALGHVEIVDSAIEPTCTTDGKTEGSHCLTCGKTLTEQKTIKAFGHDETVIKGEPATFKAAGKTDGKKCKTCGKVTVAQKTIAKLGAPSLSTVSANSKGFKATWKSVSKIDGYQIQYSTSSSFKSGKKTVTVSGYKSTSKTVKSLKAKKKYYVRIRAYKTIDGKKQYSAWSKSKTVTTKK